MVDQGDVLGEIFPAFVTELERLLQQEGEPLLATMVGVLRFHSWCECEQDNCQTFYTAAPPSDAYGRGHRNVPLSPDRGMIILDVVDDVIKCIEVLDRDPLS